MKKPLVLVSLGLLLATFAAAQMPVQLTAGGAGTNGLISFTLSGGDGTSFPVSVAVSAGDSGPTVAGKIAAGVSNPNWSASVAGSTVTFSHYTGAFWLQVSEVDSVSSTADASLTLATVDTHALLDLSFKAQVQASGYDSKGNPSFLTVNVQGEGSPLTLVLHPGQSPATIMQSIVAYLRLASTGLNFTQVSPLDVHISLAFVHSYLSVQTSDVNLQNGLSTSDKSMNDQTGLIDR